jgi:hypothetical protein
MVQKVVMRPATRGGLDSTPVLQLLRRRIREGLASPRVMSIRPSDTQGGCSLRFECRLFGSVSFRLMRCRAAGGRTGGRAKKQIGLIRAWMNQGANGPRRGARPDMTYSCVHLLDRLNRGSRRFGGWFYARHSRFLPFISLRSQLCALCDLRFNLNSYCTPHRFR